MTTHEAFDDETSSSWGALITVAITIAVAGPGCSQSPEHHTRAEVSEAKKKGKAEIGPLKDAPKGRTSPAAGSRTKKG